MIRIRQTTNIELINKLQLKYLPGDALYENPLAVYWVIWDSKVPIGFCILSTYEDHGFLARAGISYKYYGKGLQKRLIRIRDLYAKKQGLVGCLTYTHRDNIASSRNLQSCGYKLYKPFHDYAGIEFLYWIKKFK